MVQSRTAVFDASKVSVSVYKTERKQHPQQTVKQFSLNGRVFALNDSIGNPKAADLVAETAYSLEAIPGRLKVVKGAGGYFTNEGYYKPVVATTVQGQTVYSWGAGEKPSYKDVTGLTDVAIVNPTATKQLDNLPGMPVAGTAEEWLLINNSDIGHPFHIHINPFFITEVGQLVYSSAGDSWSVSKLSKQDTMGWVLNSWWDTIIIPPHGYVKFRQWINLPLQSADNTSLADNVNRAGSWVYHCHILRHEDRGMMMLVQTQQARGFNLAGNWVDPDGHQATVSVNSADSASMSFTAGSGVWWANGSGTWNGYQPFSGTQTLSNAAGSQTQTLSFNVTADGNEIGFGNGILWKQSAFTMASAPTPINLSGTWSWTDPVTTSTQTATVTQGTGIPQLTFIPAGTSKGSVWWTQATGSWNLGVGQPLTSQPYKGTLTFTQQETIEVPVKAGGSDTKTLEGSIEKLGIVVTRDAKTILFSNGMKWTKQ